jgi:hypothetical protein
MNKFVLCDPTNLSAEAGEGKCVEWNNNSAIKNMKFFIIISTLKFEMLLRKSRSLKEN